MRLSLYGAIVILALAAGLETRAAQGELLSKRYDFRDRVVLEVSETEPGGLRLDTVQFQLPAQTGDRLTRVGGLLTARVAVSNTGSEARKVGLAIALFDDEGRLLAVASGGNKLTAIKPERQKTFSLVFDGVNAEAHKATAFQISLEPKP
jgi:hypothetical protein